MKQKGKIKTMPVSPSKRRASTSDSNIIVKHDNFLVARVRHDSEILGSSSEAEDNDYEPDFIDDADDDDQCENGDVSCTADGIASVASKLRLVNTYQAEHGLLIFLQNCPFTKPRIKDVDNNGVTIEWECTKYDDEFVKDASFVDNFPPLMASLYDDVKETQSVFIQSSKPLNPNFNALKIKKNKDSTVMMVCIPYNPEAPKDRYTISF